MEDNKRHYKFMASVLAPAWTRGIYIKPLEHISPDARVPFIRIMLTLLVVGFTAIMTLRELLTNPTRAPYIVVPAIGLIIGVFLIALTFMLSTHEGSMLFSTAKLNISKFEERRREKKKLTINSLGLRSIDEVTGEVKFSNGHVGLVYEVKGQLSMSTLPPTADAINERRRAYLVSRTATSQEMRVTSVEPNKLRTQKDALHSIVKSAELNKTAANDWRAAMANIQLLYLDELVARGHQLTMLQTVILRDVDEGQLQRTKTAFERGAASGMYERYRLITDRDEIIERLSGVAMMEGVEK